MLLTVLALAPCAEAALVPIAGVTSKSDYAKGSDTYPARGINDGKSRPWFEGDPGSGVGSWITVDLGGEHTVTKVVMFAGDWRSGTGWKQANRPKEVELQWSDGTTAVWTLTDEWKPQTFTVPSPKATSTIRFKINQIFNGSAFPDTAISEIKIYDDKPDPNPAIRSVTASSESPTDADGSYAAGQAADGIVDTFWCEGNKTSDGTGESLTFTLEKASTVSAMSICTGMCALGSQGKGNSPTHATLTFSDGSTQSLDLTGANKFSAKDIAISPPRTTSSVTLRIDAVAKGTSFDDACVSEVAFKK